MYKNSVEHLNDELSRIDRILSSYVAVWRKLNVPEGRETLGLYISDEEIDSLTSNASLQKPGAIESVQKNPSIRAFAEKIERNKRESARKGIELRLVELASLFQLTPSETDILLLAVAPELDEKYQRIYAYLQNDITKKRPTVNLVISLLFSETGEKFRARDLFNSNGHLGKYSIVTLVNEGSDMQLPLLHRALQVDERIIRYLTGSDEYDDRLIPFLSADERTLPAGHRYRENSIPGNLKKIAGKHATLNDPVIFSFHGPYGTGKKHTAAEICRNLSQNLLIVDSQVISDDKEYELLKIILREALLQKSWIFFDNFDTVLTKDDPADVRRLFDEMDRFSGWIFLGAGYPVEPPKMLKNHAFYHHAFHYPSYETRKYLWTLLLDGQSDSDTDVSALATAFRFSAGQIKDAVNAAWRQAKSRNPDQTVLSRDDLYQGCKAQSNRNLSVFARQVRPGHTWNDIVLPADTRKQLEEICNYIKYRERVYSDWGFEEKISLGKGLNVLFSGPSGTGKTMAAEIIAAESSLDMYKIDLASVVSKYIGETEKNLNAVFREAGTSNAILFFDEADALFGKRTEVRDAHDRYANIEINYLLQKMEEYEGAVILASNFPRNIDDAFRRRMHFSIDFSLPERDLRQAIWEHIFPDTTPLGDDIDFRFLSDFKISGGNIKNIALNAAFLAAADSGVVTMKCLVRATRREFQKIGRLYVKEEFGPYYPMIEGDAA